MVFLAVVFVSLLVDAFCQPVYDTGLALKLNSVALSTSEDDYLAIAIDTRKGTTLTAGYVELLLLEKNNRSDVQSLYYNPEDNTVRLESYHELSGHSRKIWLLESRNYERLILVAGSEWVKLLADCEEMGVFDAFGQEDLLSFLRGRDLEVTYPDDVKLQLYKEESEATDSQCPLTEQRLPEDYL